MNAILKYPGAKWSIADWVISHFPAHKVYCEPFFGSGAVFFNKTPVYTETINDIDGNIVNLFKVCREQPEELARLVEFTPFSREEFTACYQKADDPEEYNLEKRRQDIYEEISDVIIMLAQLIMIYDGGFCEEELCEIIGDKVKRLAQRLENTKNEVRNA